MGRPDGEFDRGHAAGGIDERLSNHDRHFEKINGSMEKVATELHNLAMAVQRLGDQAESNAKTVITTAAALKDANDARRNNAESSWSPWQKGLAVLGAALATIGLYLAFVRG